MGASTGRLAFDGSQAEDGEFLDHFRPNSRMFNPKVRGKILLSAIGEILVFGYNTLTHQFLNTAPMNGHGYEEHYQPSIAHTAFSISFIIKLVPHMSLITYSMKCHFTKPILLLLQSRIIWNLWDCTIMILHRGTLLHGELPRDVITLKVRRVFNTIRVLKIFL